MRILRSGKHYVVTRHLPFNRKTAVDPPHCGVKEEQRTNHFLSQVRPVIPTLEVGCLVQYDGIQFFAGEFAQGPTRKSDHRMEETEGGWDAQAFRSANRNPARCCWIYDAVRQGSFERNTTLLQRSHSPQSAGDSRQATSGEECPREKDIQRPLGRKGNLRRADMNGYGAVSKRLRKQEQRRNRQHGREPHCKTRSRVSTRDKRRGSCGKRRYREPEHKAVHDLGAYQLGQSLKGVHFDSLLFRILRS